MDRYIESPFIGAMLAATLADAFRPVRHDIRLGSGRRPKKGPPPKPTNKRASVKAARKANRKRKSKS